MAGKIATKTEIFRTFSEIFRDSESSISERMKAAEFLMKYCYNTSEAAREEGKVMIIDDIKEHED